LPIFSCEKCSAKIGNVFFSVCFHPEDDANSNAVVVPKYTE